MHLTLEALMSLILLVFFIAVPLQGGGDVEEKLNDLYIIQKEHDLMKVWGMGEELNEEMLREDFEFVFPKKGGIVEVNGGKVFIGSFYGGGEIISSEGSVFINGIKYRVKVSVGKVSVE